MQFPGQREQTSVADTVRELWDLLQGYARQETVDPLRNVGNSLKWGIPGAVLVGTGTALMALGLLRVLQTVEVFDDAWSWAPYLITLAAVGVVIALLVRSIVTYLRTPGSEPAGAAAGAPPAPHGGL